MEEMAFDIDTLFVVMDDLKIRDYLSKFCKDKLQRGQDTKRRWRYALRELLRNLDNIVHIEEKLVKLFFRIIVLFELKLKKKICLLMKIM